MEESQNNQFNDSPRVLVVDDEQVIREILSDFLSLEGFQVASAPDGIVALELLDKQPFDMVISDLKMPNMGGLELLENIRSRHESILTVITTGYGTVETAIEAMKKGAYDYILKPFKVEEVVHIVWRGIEKQRLVSENIHLKEIISLHELSERLEATLSLDEVIDSILTTSADNIGSDLSALYLKGEDVGGTLEPIAQHLHPDAPLETQIGEINSASVMRRINNEKSILVNGNGIGGYFTRMPNHLTAFMAVPLVTRNRTIGILAAFSFVKEGWFTEGQRKLLAMLGSRAAAAVDNAILHSNLQTTFQETIQGLARALEAMDKYTAGHSDRVTVYAKMIAEALEESPEDIENITQAGMLHDIGKLGCHANLNKAGKLTLEEYEIFKAHPVYGKEILEPIRFLRHLIPGVHYHHERWDGNGYPDGLAGDAIPKMARILAVADTYDAMTSNRAYRRALEHSVAIAELQRCAGTQFDPTMVEVFLITIEDWRRQCKEYGIPIPE